MNRHNPKIWLAAIQRKLSPAEVRVFDLVRESPQITPDRWASITDLFPARDAQGNADRRTLCRLIDDGAMAAIEIEVTDGYQMRRLSHP